MIGWVLVVTLVGLGQGFYSGDEHGAQANKPHVFTSAKSCSEVMVHQATIFADARRKNPNMPAATFECMTLDKAPIVAPGKAPPPRTDD